MIGSAHRRRTWSTAMLAASLLACFSVAACTRTPEERRYATADEAARDLIETVKTGNLDQLLALFGPDARELVASSDPATGRRNREVFVAAAAEGWRLEDRGADIKELVIGNEDWPFPVPLVKDTGGWRFDTDAGEDEILARRIGRNELAVIDICHAYVAAQRAYARSGHDGKPAGVFARRFNSEAGLHNGLYWQAARGEPRSPLGDLVAAAAGEGYDLGAGKEPAPFHGYYFRILTAQGPSAPGGARDYLSNGELSGGFALVAWPARYDATGIMTFIVNADGTVLEKDLGPETVATVKAMALYNPDGTWRPAASDSSGTR